MNVRSYVGALYRKRRVDGKAPWRYYESFDTALEQGFRDDRNLKTCGPVQIRCLRHGWALVGSRGTCPACESADPWVMAQEAASESLERFEDFLTHLSA